MRPRHNDVYRITTAHAAPTAEQLSRQRTYLIMMFTRMVAIVVAVVVPGFWRIIAVAAGVILPYMAVVLVNAVHARDAQPAETAFLPAPAPELDGTPFEGIVIPDDASELDD